MPLVLLKKSASQRWHCIPSIEQLQSLISSSSSLSPIIAIMQSAGIKSLADTKLANELLIKLATSTTSKNVLNENCIEKL